MKNLYKILASSIAIFAFCACSQEEMPVNQSDNNQSEVVTRSATGIKNIVYIEVNDKSNGKKAPKRINKLTNARIKKEIEFLAPMFAGIDDEDKKSLVNSLVEEAAFLKVACFQAKEELKKEGLKRKP